MGEVVVTRLNNIFFLLRFGTGDLSRLITDKCPCGRTSYRLAGIAGRVGDAVKVRGLFVAPSQIKMIQAKYNNLPLQVVVSRMGHEDILKYESKKYLKRSAVLCGKKISKKYSEKSAQWELIIWNILA